MITLPREIVFHVNSPDINAGEIKNCYRCPLAHAFTRAIDTLLADVLCLTHDSVEVQKERIIVRIGQKGRYQIWRYILPASGSDFINSFDQGFVVNPTCHPIKVTLIGSEDGL